jgi:UDP-N-acetylglucosamine 2-epimerase (non-hydrolysing)
MGTRPEAIKMAPVIEAFSKYSKKISVSTVLTGQHQELMQDGLSGFDLKIDLDLKISNSKNDLRFFFTQLLTSLTTVVDNFNPDLVIVHGDTASAAAASIVAHFSKVKIAHVEAGLRSFDLDSPWPEEANRRIIDSVAEIMFTPTELASQQIFRDKNSKIILTGNTVIDALKMVTEKISSNPKFLKKMEDKYGVWEDNFILVTQHRRESFGRSHELILEAIQKIAARGHHIVFPVHPNPAIHTAISKSFFDMEFIHLIEPLPYPEFIYLLTKARLAISDSGGIQEEAPSLGVPLLITRELTERPEALLESSNSLVGNNCDLIVKKALDYLTTTREINQGKFRPSVFGDGTAGSKIAEYCANFLVS